MNNPLSWIAVAAILGALAYSAVRRAPLSLTLAFAILVVFFLDVVNGIAGLGSPLALDLAWIHVPGFASPPWTIVTTIFVHAGVVHLMFNLLGFLLITPIVEERIGSLRWAIVFFAGALFGELIFWLVHAADPFALVGASGGLLAILGAFARLYPRERITLFLPLPGLPGIPVIWLAIGFLLFSFVLASGGGVGIAHEVHIAGLAFGFAAAPLAMRVPVRTVRKAVPVDTAALEALATTPELGAIVAELRRADVAEIRDAWLEAFAGKVRCPTCGGPLQVRRGGLTSPCGWRLRGDERD